LRGCALAVVVRPHLPRIAQDLIGDARQGHGERHKPWPCSASHPAGRAVAISRALPCLARLLGPALKTLFLSDIFSQISAAGQSDPRNPLYQRRRPLVPFADFGEIIDFPDENLREPTSYASARGGGGLIVRNPAGPAGMSSSCRRKAPSRSRFFGEIVS
jgi:hypothetical protein